MFVGVRRERGEEDSEHPMEERFGSGRGGGCRKGDPWCHLHLCDVLLVSSKVVRSAAAKPPTNKRFFFFFLGTKNFK